jgi:hypothetical protein
MSRRHSSAAAESNQSFSLIGLVNAIWSLREATIVAARAERRLAKRRPFCPK